MTKVLAVTLRFWEEKRVLVFRMKVPVNVFSIGELLVRPAPGTDQHPIAMRSVNFEPGTDGVVDVSGATTSHSLEQAYRFLDQHPDVSDLRIVPKS